MIEIFRDPVWQFIGVIVAILATALTIWLSSRTPSSASTGEAALLERLKNQHTTVSSGYEKHKKRKGDGILLSNISSDFFNQFPVSVGLMAAHLDDLYTPENFGASTWLAVFQRLTAEGYFVPVDQRPADRLQIDTNVDSGPKLKHWLKETAKARRSIQGLDD